MTTTYTTATERAKYNKVWLDPRYRVACHSLKLWQTRRELFPATFSSALDIGCGLGLLIDVWNSQGIDAHGVDISHNAITHDKVVHACLWEMVCLCKEGWKKLYQFGICTDVMEHIPRDRVTETLRRISLCCEEVLFKIAHEHNELGSEILHLTREPVKWWLDNMSEIGGDVEFLGTELRSGCQDSLIRWRTPVIE